MKLPAALRWALVPVASMATCSGTVLVTDAVGKGAARVITPGIGGHLEAMIPTDVRVGVVYAIAAAVWVVAGAWVAPRYRVAVAFLLYLAGAYLAWTMLRAWSFPEGHPRGYQQSRVPLVLTLTGGLLGTAIVMVKRRRTAEPVAGSGTRATVPQRRRAG